MFNKIFSSLILVLFISTSQGQQAALTKESFSMINLDYPGLQLVKKAYDANDYDRAASELLHYYRQKDSSKKPDFSNAEQAIEVGTAISKDMQTMADNSLSHHFKSLVEEFQSIFIAIMKALERIFYVLITCKKFHN